MSYQVLARKYRPQTFEDLIGQAHVATTLMNALKSQKVAHAYLFSGPRGVGKTTAARILAKALNCEKGPTPEPCNACDSCLRIAQGQEMVDVLEIDAASNRGIEEIRELRDNVRYAPARGRYKVYIVDEAHQITHDAFNAFLKTLEEPPEHAVFVLATTEHQKIPATILSRCQLFRFKRVSVGDLSEQLGKILKKEKLSVEPAAIQRLARAAGGSVRDALSLLDQALAYTTDTLTAKQVEMLLGFLPDEFLQGFASALLERKPAGVLEWTRQLADEGWEIPQFVRDFREFLRQTVIQQVGSATAKTPAFALAGQSTTLAEVLHMIKMFGHCLEEMRWNDNPQLVLELYSLRLTQPFVDAGDLLRKIELLESRVETSAPLSAAKENSLKAAEPSRPPLVARSAAVSPVVPDPFTTQRPLTAVSRPALIAPKVETAKPIATPEPVTTAPASADTSALWKLLQAELWKKPGVASHMERAFLKSATANNWLLAFPDKFSMDSVQRSQSFVQEALVKIVGRPMGLSFMVEARDRRETEPMEVTVPSKEPASITDTAETPKESSSENSDHPSVQKVLDVFKGRVRL